MKQKIEYRRVFNVDELRAEKTEGKRSISGYAAVFDSESEPLYGFFREVIRQGAFTKTVSEGDQVLVWSHDMSKPLARKSADTLEIREDARGLWFRASLNTTSWAEDAFKAIESRDVTQMSFGFSVVKDRWTYADGDFDQRELLEVALHEISPVAFPAYTATEVQARSIYEASKGDGADTSELPEAARVKVDDTTPKPDADAHHSEAGQHQARMAMRRRKLQMEALL